MVTAVENRPLWKWVVGISEGRVVLLGPYPPDPDITAEEIAMEKFPTSDFEIVKMKYRSTVNATHALRHMRLENSTIQEALERIRHKI